MIVPTVLRGFPVALDARSSQDLVARSATFQNNSLALRYETDANLLLDGCAFTDNQTAISLVRIGQWLVNDVVVARNTVGLDLGNHWSYALLPREEIALSNNAMDLFLRTSSLSDLPPTRFSLKF